MSASRATWRPLVAPYDVGMLLYYMADEDTLTAGSAPFSEAVRAAECATYRACPEAVTAAMGVDR